MRESNHIFIYNPSIKTGGTVNLLVNLAILLSNNKAFKVHYIDYQNSPARNIIKNSTNRITHLNISNKKHLIIREGILIATLLSLKTLKTALKITEDIRILLWSTHPDDGLKILPSFNLWLRLPLNISTRISKIIHPFFKRRLREFITEGMKNSGIVWMDKENINSNKAFYKLAEAPIILPIFTGHPKRYKKKFKEKEDKHFKIVILGRLTNFKVYSYRGIFEQIKAYQETSDKVLFIDFIGDGPLQSLVEQWLLELNIKNYRFLGHIDLSRLDEQIIKYHLLIGMGTSTLEGAKLNVPSLLSDGTYEVLAPERTRLRWIFEVEPFHVGRFISDANSEVDGKTFSQVMLDINSFEKWKETSEKCFNHWQSYHSPEAFLLLIKMILNNNTFYFSRKNQLLVKPDVQGRAIDKLKKLFQ